MEEKLDISNMIYEIRGKQVMLDSDLAKLYECKNGTKEVNQAVKNNIDKFPDRYSWVLTIEELESLRSKNLTTSYSNKSRSIPRVFTEQGVAMLATIIKSKVATETSIKIMDAFVSMKHYINDNEYRLSNVESKVLEHDNSIKLLQELFEEDKEYYLDKEYDAYSKVLDIFNKSKNELIIVDSYADKNLLDIISNLKVNVVLITSNKTKLTKLDIEKYNKTYNNLVVYYDDTYHDRYFIIDRRYFYLSGNSINYIGYRKSTIVMMNDKDVTNNILKNIERVID